MTASGGDSVLSAQIERRVEWPDTDAAGHYHHSTILRWIEAAEAELYEQVGLTDMFGVIPRVHLEVNHRARLWFRDKVDVRIEIAKLGRASITLRFEVRRAGELAADGSMTAVHIDPAAGKATPWPDAVRAALMPSAEPGT